MSEGTVESNIRARKSFWDKLRGLRQSDQPIFEQKLMPIDGTIKRSKTGSNSFDISVGNTGLRLTFFELEGSLVAKGDFMPEGSSGKGEVSPLKAMEIFCFAIRSIKNWYGKGLLASRKLGTMRSWTNVKFAQFLERFFRDNNHEELFKEYGRLETGTTVEIDMQKFMSLPSEDQLISKIEKFADRARSLQIKTWVPAKSVPKGRGFSSLIVIALVAIVSFVALAFFLKDKPAPLEKVFREQSHEDGQQAHGDWPILWGVPETDCEKKEVKFSALPMGIADILYVEPMGELKEGHIVPGDHIGINYATSPSSVPVKVYAPADAKLVRVEAHPYNPPSGYPQNIRHYHVYLIHSCTLFSGFVHLTDFDSKILEADSILKKVDESGAREFTNIQTDIELKAGQVIGTTWSFGLLGMVTVDLNVTNSGYLRPESYEAENWRIHAVSPFDYFNEPQKAQILAKNPRTVEPRGGKIDFDIDGKIVGNWFGEGSGGFRDLNAQPKLCGNFPCPYWEGHLALVYDYVDPTQLRVSVGYNAGLLDGTPYGVRGNGPDFKDVGAEDSLVKYELVGLRDVTSERGWPVALDPLIEISDESKFLGTMFVQMLEPQKIKMEVFPGKTRDQVSGFTSKAKIYTR